MATSTITEIEDKHAKDFDYVQKALQKALTVHKEPLPFKLNKSVSVSKIDIEGVPEAFLLTNVLTPKECKDLIDFTEKLGYTDAPLTTGLNSAVLDKGS